MSEAEEILAIEKSAFASWPAAEVEKLGGWRLRFNYGVTNRGSSVWPGPDTEPFALTERLDAVERFYAERSGRACYQLTPVCSPSHLDAVLEERGYEAYAHVSVETADVDTLAAGTLRPEIEVRCFDALPEEWFDVSARRGRFQGRDEAVYRALLGRLHGRTGFAQARVGGQVAAVGLAVASAPWVGVFSMLTLEGYRGLRLAEAVLTAIAYWADERGARQLYLQVEVENTSARRLYERVGFSPRYRYHYRRQPGP